MRIILINFELGLSFLNHIAFVLSLSDDAAHIILTGCCFEMPRRAPASAHLASLFRLPAYYCFAAFIAMIRTDGKSPLTTRNQ